ncbi:Conserved hypothetical protein, precursor [Deinococcus deserti VCD115]|uniref:Uncharacterized protein n=2 Tax=Deinococcus TaxID=1298 RepID=C1CZI5_DEIDV|nr:Conserved hypothetical protein, precursor [Deinococcus deserti VCD115]
MSSYAKRGMKAARFLFPVLALASLAVAQPLTVGWQTKLAALLPLAAQPAVLMERRASLSLVDLSLRVMNVGGDPQALNQVMASAQRGEMPAYNERLGISKKEFLSYLVFQPTLASTSRTLRLAVNRDSNRVSFGDAPGMNGILKGVSIDLRTGEMRGPEGFTAKATSVAPSNAADRLLDVRSGFQWNIRGNNAGTGNGVRGVLNLLQLSSGDIILSYTRTSMLHSVTTTGELIVQYTR